MPPITKKVSDKKTVGKKTATVISNKKNEEQLKKDKTVALKNNKTVAKIKSPKVEKTIKDKKLQTTPKDSKIAVKSSKSNVKESKIVANNSKTAVKDSKIVDKSSKNTSKNSKTIVKGSKKMAKDSKTVAKDSKSKTVASKAVTEKIKKETKTPKIVKSKEKALAVKESSKKTVDKKTVDKKVAVKSVKPVKESVKKIVTPTKSTKKELVTEKITAKKTTAKTVIDLPVKEKVIATKSLKTDVKVKKSKKVKENNVDFVIATTLGNIDIRLFPDKAPITASNFLRYVASDYYSNTVFHRIIRGFMIQGGGYDKTLSFKEDTLLPIKIESNNGLKNLRGTIAMARTNDPHSATSQFFINLTDNPHLDFAEETIERYGYTVFAKVTKGLDIVDKIGNSPTTTVYHHQNVPATPITIKSITNKVK